MKPLMVLVSFLSATSAGYGGGGGTSFSGSSAGYAAGGSPPGYSGGPGGGLHNGGYSGAGIGGFGGGYPNPGGGYSGAEGPGYMGGGGQIRKFVSVHVGPEDPQITQTKVIRAGGAPERHINVIFVKAPMTASHQNTEVILPEAPQQKTLVYVLVKKQESSNNVRVRGPAPTRPTKPEVYFIRYKDGITGPATIPVTNNAAAPAYGPPQSGGAGLNPAHAGY